MANSWSRAGSRPTLESISKLDIRSIKPTLERMASQHAHDPEKNIHFETNLGAKGCAYFTPCNFGGVRWWLRCPSCSKGRMILYFIKKHNILVCRTCTNAVHASSQAGKTDRGIDLRWKILRRYGLDKYGLDALHKLDMYDKPKRIRKATWERVISRYMATFERQSAIAKYYSSIYGDCSQEKGAGIAWRERLKRAKSAAYMRAYRARKKQDILK